MLLKEIKQGSHWVMWIKLNQCNQEALKYLPCVKHSFQTWNMSMLDLIINSNLTQ